MSTRTTAALVIALTGAVLGIRVVRTVADPPRSSGAHEAASSIADEARRAHRADPQGPPETLRATRPLTRDATRFDILRGPLADGEVAGPPQGLAAIEKLFRVRTSEARVAQAPDGGVVHVIPGPRHICVASGEMINCARRRDARLGETAGLELCGASLPRGSTRIVGLVPNDVHAVTLELRDGRRVTADVHDNVYASVVDGVIERVHVEIRDRQREVDLQVPPDFTPELCAGPG